MKHKNKNSDDTFTKISFPDWMRPILAVGNGEEPGKKSAHIEMKLYPGEDDDNINKYIDWVFNSLNNIVSSISKYPKKESEEEKPESQNEKVNQLVRWAHVFYEQDKYEACVEIVNEILNNRQTNGVSRELLEEILLMKTAILSDSLPISPKQKVANLEEAIRSYEIVSENDTLSNKEKSLMLNLLSLKYRYQPDIPHKTRLLRNLVAECDSVLELNEKGENDTEDDKLEILLTKAWVLSDLIEQERNKAVMRLDICSILGITLKLLHHQARNSHYWALCSYSLPFLTQISSPDYWVGLLERSCSILESIVDEIDEPNRAILGNMAWMYTKLAKNTTRPHLAAYSLGRARDLLSRKKYILEEDLKKQDLRKEAYHYLLSNTYVNMARVETVDASLSVTCEQKISHLHSAISLCETAINLNPYNAGARARHTKAIVMLSDYHYSKQAMGDMLTSAIQKCMDALSFAIDPAHLYHAMSLAYGKLAIISDSKDAARYKEEADRYNQLANECNVLNK